jgi:Undecaprenyl-phosphate glucose phosphotransferase
VKAKRLEPISEPIVCGLVALFDVAAILMTGVWTAWLTGIDLSVDRYFVATTALLGAVLTGAFLYFASAYKFDSLSTTKTSALLAAQGISAMIAIQFIFAWLMDGVHRINPEWLISWLVGGAGVVALGRVFLGSQFVQWYREGRVVERIAIVGSTELACGFLNGLTNPPRGKRKPWGIHVVGIFDDRQSSSPQGDRKLALDRDGTIDDLIELIRHDRVDAVVLAIPLSCDKRVAQFLETFRHTPVDVRLCPDQVGLRLGRFTTTKMGDQSLLTVAERPLCHWRKVAKAIEDRVLGAVILAMIAPVMAVIAIAIKFDSPGPVLFRQKRLGYNNQIIEVLKFRTMHHNMADPDASQLTRRNDPRVTRLGAFLRKTSLDELPQFINVVRGDMSIVGPRPHALQAKAGGVIYHDAVDLYDARHRMKPGITGWAQINGWRGETDTVEQLARRVECDLYYVENWSVTLDLQIIVRTIFSGFMGKSAY